VAAKTPEKVLQERVDPALGLRTYQTRRIAQALGLTGPAVRQAGKMLSDLSRLFVEKDVSMLEINPLVVTESGDLIALDAKLQFDDNAMFRQKDVLALRDVEEEDPLEAQASEADLSYIRLDGNIGCMVNGAGLAMATMDLIQYVGGVPANFLDVGGGRGRRFRGEGLSNHPGRHKSQGDPDQYLRRHRALRPRGARRCRGSRECGLEGARGRASGRDQCRRGAHDPGGVQHRFRCGQQPERSC